MTERAAAPRVVPMRLGKDTNKGKIAPPPAKITAWRKRLLESTRGQIIKGLRTGERTVNELVAELGLTDTAIRAHLISLERDGFIRQAGTRPGVRKPHATYGLTPEAEEIFPKSYGPLLDTLLTVLSRNMPPRQLRAAMREVGQRLAQEHLPALATRDREERIEVALRLLQEMGGVRDFSGK